MNCKPLQMFNTEHMGWSHFHFYNPNSAKFCYSFTKMFHRIYHHNPNGTSALCAISIVAALNASKNGATYIYHEQDYYIPYRIENNYVRFNTGDPVLISSIKPKLNTNVIIATNIKNRITRAQTDTIMGACQSIFINNKSNTFNSEFIMNHHQTIPYEFWFEKSTFKDIFNQQFNEDATFMLLSIDNTHGIPIGIDYHQQYIILNTNGSSRNFPFWSWQFH